MSFFQSISFITNERHKHSIFIAGAFQQLWRAYKIQPLALVIDILSDFAIKMHCFMAPVQ